MLRSSAEAEYKSLASIVAELVWLVGMLQVLKVEVQLPVQVYSDNNFAIKIASNLVYHERTKHIEIDCHFIREKLQQGLIKMVYIATKNHPTDILTKDLHKPQVDYFSAQARGLRYIFTF